MVLLTSGKTKVLGIIGFPVRHSLSPLMHNAALHTCGLDYHYVPFEVSPDSLHDAIVGMKALGVAGFNVTIPHKVAIMAYLDSLDESALAAGAVNTVVNQSGNLVGYNTDGDGLVRSLAMDCSFDPLNMNLVIIGAGGAARGAISALCRAGAQSITLVNRTLETADQLAESMSQRYTGTTFNVRPLPVNQETVLSNADLLLNTTSIGMKNEKIEGINLGMLRSSAVVYDMVYSPHVTPLLKDAKELGVRCANGIGMLVCQGELAFHLWTGTFPPQDTMKSALADICRI